MNKNPAVSVYRHPDPEATIKDIERELASYKQVNKDLHDEIKYLKDKKRKLFLPEIVLACGILWTIISTLGVGTLTYLFLKKTGIFTDSASGGTISFLTALVLLIGNVTLNNLIYQKMNKR